MAPQPRARVGTNPVTVQERSPTHHRRSASDVKGEGEADSHHDSPWGKRLRPATSKKPAVPSASSLADLSHRPPASSGEKSPSSPAPVQERLHSGSTSNSPSHLHPSSGHQRTKSSSPAEAEGMDLEGAIVNGSELVSPKRAAPLPAPPRVEVSRTSVSQPSMEEDHSKDSGEVAVVKKPRPPRPPPYVASKQAQPERERNGMCACMRVCVEVLSTAYPCISGRQVCTTMCAVSSCVCLCQVMRWEEEEVK